jgi:hypothetical protein
LFVGQHSSGSEGPTGPPAGEGVDAIAAIGRPPSADGLVANAQEFGEFDFGVSEFEAAEGAEAEQLKGVIGEFTGVG